MELKVKTTYGIVEGYGENGICKWLGIPFAKPPIGKLRFKRAVSCGSWSDVRQARTFGNRPIQFAKSGAASQLPESEDCLYLNVWAPKYAVKCPVLVWIYGGGGHGGEGSARSYYGDSFAKDSVVYVSFNYRLGPLGFYNFNLIDKSFDSNCALSDMLMALRWIKENIEFFGGDPENVTISGQSAGAAAVFSLLAAHDVRGLFHKAIAMSPTIGSSYQNITHFTNNKLFFDQLGISHDEVYKLKNMPVEQMKDAALYVFLHAGSARQGNTFSAYVIDDLLPVPVYEALAQGSAAEIPVIFGCCLDEGGSFYKSGLYPTSRQDLQKLLVYRDCPEKIVDMDALYPDDCEVTMKRMGGDLLFGAEVARGLNDQSKYATAYSFRYDFLISESIAEGGLGACHGADVEVALATNGTLLTSLFGEEAVRKADGRRDAISKIMHGAWVNFCKTGTPNGELPIEWLPYTALEKNVFIFNDECKLVRNPDAGAYVLWNEIDYYAEPDSGNVFSDDSVEGDVSEFVLP